MPKTLEITARGSTLRAAGLSPDEVRDAVRRYCVDVFNWPQWGIQVDLDDDGSALAAQVSDG